MGAVTHYPRSHANEGQKESKKSIPRSIVTKIIANLQMFEKSKKQTRTGKQKRDKSKKNQPVRLQSRNPPEKTTG